MLPTYSYRSFACFGMITNMPATRLASLLSRFVLPGSACLDRGSSRGGPLEVGVGVEAVLAPASILHLQPRVHRPKLPLFSTRPTTSRSNLSLCDIRPLLRSTFPPPLHRLTLRCLSSTRRLSSAVTSCLATMLTFSLVCGQMSPYSTWSRQDGQAGRASQGQDKSMLCSSARRRHQPRMSRHD